MTETVIDQIRLKALLRNFNGGILVEDENRNIVYVNQTFCDFLKIPVAPENLIGTNCAQAAEQSKSLFKDPNRFMERVEKLLDSAKSVVNEEVEFADGRVFERDFIPVIEEKQNLGLMWVYRDITERKKAEEAGKEKERLVQSYFDTSPMMMGLVELEGEDIRHLSDNKSVGDLFGCDPSQLAGKLASEIGSTQEYIALWVKNFRESKQIGRPNYFEYMHKRKDGNVMYLKACVNFIGLSHHGKERYSYIVDDITERKIVESELKQNQEFLTTIVDHLPVALFCKDSESNFTFTLWNQMAQEMWGLSKKEVFGKSDYDFFPKEQADFFRKKDQETLLLGKAIEIPEEEIATKEKGKRYLHTVKVPVKNKNGKIRYLLGISQDITEQKQAKFKLIQASKMSSLGEMAGGIAHEINNPLAIIAGKSSQLRKKILKPECPQSEIDQDLERIYSTAMRISKIVKGLRSFSRNAENDPFEKVALIKVIEETLDLCQERLKSHQIDLRVKPIERNLILQCRSIQISQVLLNLLSNAHDAVIDLPEKWIELSVEDRGGMVRIYITDSGKGILPEVASRMMEPFFTTKEVGKGTGLGLSLSKGIIEDHLGTLRFNPDCPNTQFVIELFKVIPTEKGKK